MPVPDRSPLPRLLYFGMAGRFSAIPLTRLLAEGLPVCGVVTPARPDGPAITRREPPAAATRALPVLGTASEPSVIELAWQRGVPVYAAGRLRDPATLAALAALEPELIVVACFPWRLPAALLAPARLGGLNLHPSLLPEGRGPAPRFWTFRHGRALGGVTVHQVTPELDAGPIVAQATFPLPDGMTGAEFDRQAAALGGGLLVEAIWALAAGRARLVAQDPARASYGPWPREADYLVPLDRPARWAFNFIRGVAGDDMLPTLLLDGRHVPVRAALAYRPEGRLGASWRAEDDTLWVQCAPGLLQVLTVGSGQWAVGSRRGVRD
jgi:methionyl-tRNA formyltransferase